MDLQCTVRLRLLPVHGQLHCQLAQPSRKHLLVSQFRALFIITNGRKSIATHASLEFSHVSSQGWVEFQDFDMRYQSSDGSLTPAHKTSMWIDALLGAAAQSGREPLVGPKLSAWVTNAGFINVTERVFTFPIGGWPREPTLRKVGMINLVAILEGLEAFSMRLLCDVAGWGESDVHALLGQVHDELLSGAFHAYIKL